MAPICELKLPVNYPSSLIKDGKKVCDVALDATLSGLGIPDPTDREYRISSVNSLTDPELQISFGYGRKNQYGPGKEFMPTSEQLKGTCCDILNQVGQFGVKRVGFDGWKDTASAFMTRSLEKINLDLVVPERFKEGIKVKGNIAMRMIFSPSFLDRLGLDFKNQEEMFKNILEIFEGNGSVELQFPLEAETEIGVEVDFCDVGNENNFSGEEMSYIMHRIENCLDSGVSSDRSKITTIWVRQGAPSFMIKNEETDDLVDKTVGIIGRKV